MEGTQRRDRFEGLEEEEKEEEEEEEEEEEVEFNGDKEVIAIDEKIGNEAKTIDDKNLEMASLYQKNQSIKGKEEMSMDINLNLCPDQKDQEDQLIECAQANMGEVREENERLRTLLARMMKDYQSLRAHFLDIVQQEQANKTAPSNTLGDLHLQEPELVSLGLGRSTTLRESKKEEIIVRSSNSIKLEEDKDLKECLALTLDCKSRVSKPAGTTEPLSSPASLHERILEDPKMEAEDQPLSAIDKSPSLNKTMRSEDDEVSQPTLAKKARVSVRARCDAPTMNDGCQWRKYGQKIAKGNPCPRAYYRCTIAPACPVRKQVQRCASDMSVLITTYEGKHNHPLPIAATALASTTSAAARMLTSASSSSPPMLSFGPSTTTGLMNRSSYFYSPNNIPSSSSSPIISPSSSSHPTITLDLTSYSSSNNSSSNYNSSSSSTSLSFNNSAEPPVNSLPTIWGNDVINGYPSYQMGSSNNLGRQNHRYNMQISNPVLPPETISAATKAIASDPSFRSALAKAITSIVGVDHAGGKVCANSGLLSRSMSLSSTSKAGERSLMFLPSSSSSLSFPSRKNKSTTSTASPAENSDQVHR